MAVLCIPAMATGSSSNPTLGHRIHTTQKNPWQTGYTGTQVNTGQDSVQGTLCRSSDLSEQPAMHLTSMTAQILYGCGMATMHSSSFQLVLHHVYTLVAPMPQ